MTERVIFVEANTTGTGMLALRTARELGLVPVLATGRPERYRGLREADPELLRCDTNDTRSLLAAINSAVPRPAGVTTTSEFYLETVATIAARLGLPGNPVRAVRRCRDKSRTRRRLAAAGISQPAFAVVREPEQIGDAVRRVGLPCVVKPVDDTGSQSVRLCATNAEAYAQVTKILAVRTNVRGQPTAGAALVEEYLDGPEYSVEMFSLDGVARCVGVTAKSVTGHPYFMESGHLYPAPIPADKAAAMIAVVRETLSALGIELGPTHTEVKVSGGRVAVVEVNARLAGGMIPELIRLVDGLDLLEQQIRAAVDRRVALDAVDDGARGHAGIQFIAADREGAVDAVAGVDEARAVPGVESVEISARQGTVVRLPRTAYDRYGHVIVRGPSPDQVTSRLREARRLIRLAVSDPGRTLVPQAPE